MKRREFIQASLITGGSVWAPGSTASPSPGTDTAAPTASLAVPASRKLDLAPARWIWYPSGRTLQNTFVLFRRELTLPAKPRRASGWIAADSRYRLELNSRRVQWGPAPADPRWPEADPLDLTAALREGTNVLGATVLFYGQGDGTWPLGKPGFIFRLEIEHADGRTEVVTSDSSWKALICRAQQPGHYKRWYLRSLQEEFDARRYPYGWSSPELEPSTDWIAAMPLDCPAGNPSLASSYPEYMLEIGRGPAAAELRSRSVPIASAP